MIVETFCCRLLKANLKSQSFRYFATQTRIRFSRYNYYHEEPDLDNWLSKLTSWCVKALFCITSREPSRQQQWTKTVQFLELQPVGKVTCSCSWSSQLELRETALFDKRTGCVAPGKYIAENRKGNAVFFSRKTLVARKKLVYRNTKEWLVRKCYPRQQSSSQLVCNKVVGTGQKLSRFDCWASGTFTELRLRGVIWSLRLYST